MTEPPPLSLRELAASVRSDLRRSFRVLFLYEVLFKILAGLLLLPALVALLYHLVRYEGRTALTNNDILGFVLSPMGVIYGYVLGLKLLGLTLLEYAGAMALAAMKQTGGWRGVRHAVVALAMRAARTLRLALRVLSLLALLLLPFVATAAFAYIWLLGDQDINYYLAERPPRFYAACAIGSVLFLSAMALTGWLFVRWAFALPIVLFEDFSPGQALRESADRTKGVRRRLAGLLLATLVIGLAAQTVVVAAFKLFSGGVLSLTGERPSVVVVEVAVLLALKILLLAFLSGLLVVALSLLLLRLYVERSVRLGLLDRSTWADQLEEEPPQPRKFILRFEWGIAAVVLGFLVFYLAMTLPFGSLSDDTNVTAHRGYSRVAPENSLAAFNKAIEAGVDVIELDVQLTADGEVVVLHDADLLRMTGDRRRISRVRAEELKGILFLPKPNFQVDISQERVPTLRDAIELAREADCKLNIELKFAEKEEYKDLRLSRRVAEVIGEEEFHEACFVSSLHVPGVREAKKHNPYLKTAAIVTAAVGDISKLDVNILSVKKELANEALLRKARQLGKQVHVWTVNNPSDMRRFIELGVDNVITDEPELYRQVREERSSLGDAQRLLLTCRYLLD